MSALFDSFQLGPLALRNRIVMAPMTRSRSRGLVPDASTALYYRQRATAGLIVTEGSPVSMEGRGQAFTPGIYSKAQVAGWRKVTDAVHAEGGKIFVQLWHVGRSSHTSHQNGAPPVCPVAVAAAGQVAYAFDTDGVARPLPVSPPRALASEEIPRVTADFVRAARNALDAGFDGIELHGANGYLFEQFINGGLNLRADRYGGSIENRLRFTLETIDAIAAEIGSERIGIRLAPFGRYGDLHPFAGEDTTWLALARALSTRSIAYAHLCNQRNQSCQAMPAGFVHKFRESYRGTLIIAGGYDKARGQADISAGLVDLVAFGRPFIANPDLVERMRNNWPLAEADPTSVYGGNEKGYIDYPEYSATSSRGWGESAPSASEPALCLGY
ncbi:MAG: alkene reductase [Pseudoxanthomonas sp.]